MLKNFVSVSLLALAMGAWSGTAGAVPITCNPGCVAAGANKCICDAGGSVLVDPAYQLLIKAWGGGGSGSGPSTCYGTNAAFGIGGGGGFAWMRIRNTQPFPYEIVAGIQPPASGNAGGGMSSVAIPGGSAAWLLYAAGGGSAGCARATPGGIAPIVGSGGAGGGSMGQAGTNAGPTTGGQGGTNQAPGANGLPSAGGSPFCAVGGEGGLGIYGGGRGGFSCSETGNAASGGGGGASWLRAELNNSSIEILAAGTGAGSGIAPGASSDGDSGGSAHGYGGLPAQPGKPGRVVFIALPGSGGPTVDLSVGKLAGSETIPPGKELTYSIQATNNNRLGIGVTPVQVTDEFPAALTSCSWTCSVAPGGTCNAGSGTRLVDLAYLGPHATATYTVSCKVDDGAPAGALANTATVEGLGVTDPNLSNNEATAIVEVVP